MLHHMTKFCLSIKLCCFIVQTKVCSDWLLRLSIMCSLHVFVLCPCFWYTWETIHWQLLSIKTVCNQRVWKKQTRYSGVNVLTLKWNSHGYLRYILINRFIYLVLTLKMFKSPNMPVQCFPYKDSLAFTVKELKSRSWVFELSHGEVSPTLQAFIPVINSTQYELVFNEKPQDTPKLTGWYIFNSSFSHSLQ